MFVSDHIVVQGCGQAIGDISLEAETKQEKKIVSLEITSSFFHHAVSPVSHCCSY
jgi:hypothetical protein